MSKRLERSAKLAYYSFDKVFSYNAVFNFVVGARGLGKTFGAKEYVIRNAIRHGEEFIYLRRYKTELPGFKTFFADIAFKFPDWDFRVNGMSAEMAPVSSRNDKKRKWALIGQAVALSNAQAKKSVAFPRVTTIIYDEFIIEKGNLQYIPQEDAVLMDFYSTVDRWKDKTRVLFLANALSITNPYFLAYDIIPASDGSDEFIRRGDGFIIAHFPDSADFKQGVSTTRFGRFIQNTEYAERAVNSQFADNHDRLIQKKSDRANYYFTLETKKGTFSVWIDSAMPTYFIQGKRPKEEFIYTNVEEWMGEGKRLMLPNDKRLQSLRSAFTRGLMYFDSPKSRNAFIELFKR